MRILLSGICGFVGSSVAHGLLEHDSALELIGVDNLSRAGSHLNIEPLRQRGIKTDSCRSPVAERSGINCASRLDHRRRCESERPRRHRWDDE